jgi:hypothetical protein
MVVLIVPMKNNNGMNNAISGTKVKPVPPYLQPLNGGYRTESHSCVMSGSVYDNRIPLLNQKHAVSTLLIGSG